MNNKKIAIIAPARKIADEFITKFINLLDVDKEQIKLYLEQDDDQKTELDDLSNLLELSASDMDRKELIEKAFLDKEVDIIICARGGYGLLRIIDKIDYNIIKNNPKIFIGYSDITYLLNGFNKFSDLITYHGPMLIDIDKIGEVYKNIWIEFLKYRKLPLTVIEGNLLSDSSIIRYGKASGKLIGGNLSILSNMIGTNLDFDTENKILFIEDVDEKLYHIERLIIHLKRAGKFDNIAGLIIGEFADIKKNMDKGQINKLLTQIILDNVSLDIPIIFNFPVGHSKNNIILPIGKLAEVDAMDQNKLTLRFL